MATRAGIASRTRVGRYELGQTLREGNFAKVRFAGNVETGENFAINILDKEKVLSNPTSPLLFSPADDPCSPLWAFSDVNHDKLAGGGGGQALLDLPSLFQ